MRWIQFVFDCLTGHDPDITSRPRERSPWTPARAAAWRAWARRTDERAGVQIVDASHGASAAAVEAPVEARAEAG